MPKSRQRKKLKQPVQSARVGLSLNQVRYRGDMGKAQVLETMFAEFGAIDPDIKKYHAIWSKRSDTCRVPYAGAISTVEEYMLDAIIWASIEGGLAVPFSKVISELKRGPHMSMEQVEDLLGSLAKAGIIGWEPGASSVELRPCEKQE